MKTLEKQKIKTFLPVFSGFYNTIWEFNYSQALYNINETRAENNLSPINWDNIEVNNLEYENEMSKSFCDVLENTLADYVEKITFENLYNPETYNFKNNSINCIIEPKTDIIKEFIYKNKDAFCEYLKQNYTSYDGFMSHYSNRFSEWENETENFSDFSCNGHYLGSILQFIFNMLDIEICDSIYYDVKENIYECNYIENINKCENLPICDGCGEFIENEKTLNDATKYFEIMGFYPKRIFCDDCAL